MVSCIRSAQLAGTAIENHRCRQYDGYQCGNARNMDCGSARFFTTLVTNISRSRDTNATFIVLWSGSRRQPLHTVNRIASMMILDHSSFGTSGRARRRVCLGDCPSERHSSPPRHMKGLSRALLNCPVEKRLLARATSLLCIHTANAIYLAGILNCQQFCLGSHGCREGVLLSSS